MSLYVQRDGTSWPRTVAPMIDPSADRAVFRQLADLLRGQIESGELGPGEPLPSELRLAQEYGISRTTVRQAIAQLRTGRTRQRRTASWHVRPGARADPAHRARPGRAGRRPHAHRRRASRASPRRGRSRPRRHGHRRQHHCPPGRPGAADPSVGAATATCRESTHCATSDELTGLCVFPWPCLAFAVVLTFGETDHRPSGTVLTLWCGCPHLPCGARITGLPRASTGTTGRRRRSSICAGP